MLYSTNEIKEIAKKLHCEIVETTGMFVLSSQFISKLPSVFLPFWCWTEVALSKPFYGISSKAAVVLRKKFPV